MKSLDKGKVRLGKSTAKPFDTKGKIRNLDNWKEHYQMEVILLSEIMDTEFSKLSLSNDRNSFIFVNSFLISFTSDSGKSKKLLSLHCHVPFFLIPRFSKDV